MVTGWIVFAAVICILKAPEYSAKDLNNCDKGIFDEFPDTSRYHRVCVVSGDPHFRTFDSLRFDFQGNCNYTLVKHEDFEIIGDFQRMNYHRRLSVIKRLVIKLPGVQLQVDSRFNVYRVDEDVTQVTASTTIGGIKIGIYCNAVVFDFVSKGFAVYWSSPHRVIVTSHIALSGYYLSGLCGNYNKRKRDDLIGRDGELETDVLRFGHSWRTDPSCKICENCAAKTLCQTNPQYAKDAEERCSVFRGDLPSCPFQLDSGREISSPDEWNLECNSGQCIDGPSTRSFCQLYRGYGTACAEVGPNTLPSWEIPGDCQRK